MSKSCLAEVNENIIERERYSLCWKDSLSTQHLLDVVSSIIAEEYIAIAKQNPKIFQNQGDIK